ncbi:ABC transporter permease [Phytoactinopolyspora endophytica]|uniref:ABC transporter permease n=1 Tax=Phytoactinopolyspora endophytica TaxID=1642495 RepID=UPI00101C4E4F|nr:ABC transporter permease [Phytoactinopolyspora endophytica]
MIRFALRRAAFSVLLALGVSFATFVLVFSNGTAIARAILGVDATDEQVQALAHEHGLDRPVLVQFGEWLGGVLQGDLGVSYYTGEAVTDVVTSRVPVTLALLGIAMFFTAVLSALLGIASAVAGGWADRLLQMVALVGTAVPNFIVAIMLVMWLAVSARIFPATGFVPLEQDPGRWALSLALPVAAVVIASVGPASQQFRGAVKDVLERDFVRTLRARGIKPRAIVFRHVFRNAAGPGVIILGLQIIVLMGGVVVIERVFALPGIGELTVNTSLLGDIPVVMGCVLFIIVVVVVVNLAADVVNAAINPKVRQR